MQNRGLKPLKQKSLIDLLKGKRDYSHKKTFGSLDLSQLPKEYLLESTLLNQGAFPHCTAYASCAIQESQHNIQFDPEDFYIAEGIVNGSPQDEGYDMRVTMATGVSYGFKPLNGGNPSDYKEGGYFTIDGNYDLFDNIRVAMWLARSERKCANLGTEWYSNWFFKSIIDGTDDGYFTGLHDIKCAGWKQINGIDYLVIQNSYGSQAGDGGFHYFSREVVNKRFTAGHYMWRTQFEQAQIQSLFISILQKIVALLKSLLK